MRPCYCAVGSWKAKVVEVAIADATILAVQVEQHVRVFRKVL